ncbi:transposase (plasmid) [Rhodovastum atsumiense]|uniref:IS66-like element accessory protein TnpA n=1 Tax=Rhodovastum atsumiense TaxID=504468 RepID=UPI00202466A9|nr:transposase [Rhodovastum atsumiense]CAH2605904.1 transposase [Rhodovastum atsumiense]
MDGMARDSGLASRVSAGGGRRQWSAAQKAAIVAESYAAGVRVSEVAARHGVNESLVFTWRRQARTSQAMGASEKASEELPSPPASFMPVMLCDDVAVDQRLQRAAGSIEIAVADVSIRVTVGADAATLAMVLAAVRGVG